MSDHLIVRENSREHIAYKLLTHVADVERKQIHHTNARLAPDFTYADRKWILDTYAECLITVISPGAREK